MTVMPPKAIGIAAIENFKTITLALSRPSGVDPRHTA
jgi:hypothetical protein